MIFIVSPRGNRSNGSRKLIEGKLQKMLRFTKKEYKRLCPTGSKPGAFCGNANIHNLKKMKGY